MNRIVHEIEPEEVMAYLDGELEAARAGEIAAHIGACSECTAVASDIRAIATRLHEWNVEPAPHAISEGVQQATNRQPEIESAKIKATQSRFGWLLPRRRPWRIAMALGGVAAMVCAVFFFINYGRPPYFVPNKRMHSYISPAPVASAQRFSGGGGGGTDSNSSNYTLTVDGEARQAEVQRREQAAQAESLERDDKGSPKPSGFAAQVPSSPMIARTAAITLVVAKLEEKRAALEKLLARHHGFASQMNIDKSNEASPSLDATLQVPASELDAVIAELRGFGRVSTESQQGEDVSDQHVDLTARLHNARESEQRLLDILRTRTGKVSDVLEVEEQISQTRGSIEQMEAQLENLNKRVSYASIKLEMAEEYKAPADASTGVTLRLRNAIVGGYRDATESLLSLAVFLLNAGPMILLWVALLFFPARALWRRRGVLRGAFSKNAA